MEAAADAQHKKATQAGRSSLGLKLAVRDIASQAAEAGPLTLERLANEADSECSKGRAAFETLRTASSELKLLKRRVDRARDTAMANDATDAADTDAAHTDEPVRSTRRRAVRLGLFANHSNRVGDRLRAVARLLDILERRQEKAEAVARSLNARLELAPTAQEQAAVLKALLHTNTHLWFMKHPIHQQGSQGSQGGAASQGDASQGDASQATTEAASDLTTAAAPDLGTVIDSAVQNAWGPVRQPVIASIAATALAVLRGDEHQAAAADDPESGSPSARWDAIPAWTTGLAKQACVDAHLIGLMQKLGTDAVTLHALAGEDAVPPTCTEGTLDRALAQFTALAGAAVATPVVDECVPRMNDADDTDGHILSSSALFAFAYWPPADAEAAEACKHLAEAYCYRNCNQPGARRCGLCVRYSLFVPRVARLLECAPLQPHPSAFFRVERGEAPAFPAAFFCTVAGLRALHSAAEACADELATSGNSLLKGHRAKRSLQAHARCDCFSTAERIRELRNESHANCPTCWLTLPDVERPDWVDAAEGLHQQAHRGRHGA